MDEVIAAARKANIHNFVETLPMVCLTVIGALCSLWAIQNNT